MKKLGGRFFFAGSLPIEFLQPDSTDKFIFTFFIPQKKKVLHYCEEYWLGPFSESDPHEVDRSKRIGKTVCCDINFR